MTASRIQALWPWPQPTKPTETHARHATPKPQQASPSASRDAPADVDMSEPAVLPTHRYAAVHQHLFQALQTSHMPDASTVDTVMTRHEALRHLVPQFKAWLKHPERAEAFFEKTQWPPLDPVSAGVLVGLVYRARLAAWACTSDDARGTQQRVDLATATHRGLLRIPDMQPYAAILDYVQERDSHPPFVDRTNAGYRTLCAVRNDFESLPPDVSRMREVAVEVLTLYASHGLNYKRVKRAPEAIAWDIELPEPTDAAHLEKLQADIVSFVQYGNQDATGREIIQDICELIAASAHKPELLANLQFSQTPLSLRTDFIAGALVSTLYMGMLCGLRDLRRGQRRTNATGVLAHSKLVSDRIHRALAELATAIDNEHWRELAFIVQDSLDAGAGAREIHARLGSYVWTQQRDLGGIQNPTELEQGIAEQWRGVEWRLTRYPVVKL